MKRILSLLFVLFCVAGTAAQNVDPQPTYAQTMQIRNPSTWLRFNGSSATSFSDSVGGTPFTPTAQLTALPTINAAFPLGFTVLNGDVLPGGGLASVTIQFFTAPPAGQPVLIVIAESTGGFNFTIVDSFTVNVAATTAPQTFHSGTDYTPRNVTGGNYIGYFVSSADTTQVGVNNSTVPQSEYVYSCGGSTTPCGPSTYSRFPGVQNGLTAVITSNGTVTPLQPGFDLNQKNNFSAGFSHNAWASAPNGTIGNFEWSAPHSFHYYVDSFTLNRLGGGTITLAYKGDYVLGNGWALDIEPDSVGGNPLTYRVCYHEHGSVNVSPFAIASSVCTGINSNAIANGTGINIEFSDAGTGFINDDHLYLNGLDGGGLGSGAAYTSNFNLGFNFLNFSVTGGAGYPALTPVNVTGGGPNCHVNVSMQAVGGVPNGNFSTTQNSGCTVAPTCTLAASSGSGATISCALVPSTLSSGSPLMVGGPQGMSTDSAQSPVDVDEFAIFPTALQPTDAVNIFYSTNWYQQVLGNPPATPPLVLFSDDGSADPDNQYALAMAIGAHLRGYIKLVGVINQDLTGSCAAMWRQMLDQAGLNHIPLAVNNTFASGGTGCDTTGGVAIYNASTPTASSGYMDSTVLYRTLLAHYSTTAVQLFNASNVFTDLATFMQSPADGISPLTGAQLLAQDATNGGGIYAQGAQYCIPTSPPTPFPCTASYVDPTFGFDWASVQYVLTHNAGMNIFWIAGTPYVTGQDLPVSRTAKDPMFIYSTNNGPRQAWDTMALLPAFTNRFEDPVMITVTGGAGYATWTPIDQTGGGTNCPTQLGWMHSTGGVPDGIQFTGGGDSQATYLGIYVGLGFGCTSTPTLSLPGATGTGAVLTPTLNTHCGTITITIGSPNTTVDMTSATCANHIFTAPSATTVESPDIPSFLWFVNSLMDPPPVGQPRLQN